MDGMEILIPLAFFTFLGVVIIAHVTARHKERMAMVEKGMSSEDIKALYVRQINRDPLTSLKWGILFVLAGVSVLVGNYLHQEFGLEEGAIFGLIMLFVGAGLVLFYTIASKKINQ